MKTILFFALVLSLAGCYKTIEEKKAEEKAALARYDARMLRIDSTKKANALKDSLYKSTPEYKEKQAVIDKYREIIGNCYHMEKTTKKGPMERVFRTDEFKEVMTKYKFKKVNNSPVDMSYTGYSDGYKVTIVMGRSVATNDGWQTQWDVTADKQ